MDVTASSIAILSFALSSTQEIYKAITGIQDGPAMLQQTATGLRNLSHVLLQFQNCTESLLHAPAFLESVNSCAIDLGQYEEKIKRLQAAAHDNKTKRIWKRVKTILCREDLRRLSSCVQQHVATLSLQLDILNSYVRSRSLTPLIH